MSRPGRWGWRLAVSWILPALIASPGFGQEVFPPGCIPGGETGLFWEESFLRPVDLDATGWRVTGEPSWRVVRESLDAGNGDLFTGPTMIMLPAAATEGQTDYLVTTVVWNTQREGMFLVGVRCVDERNYYACEYMSGPDFLALLLVKVRDGVRTVLDRVDSVGGAVRIPDLTYGAGKRNAAVVTVGAFGDRLCTSVGGRVRLEARDGDLAAGGVILGQRAYHPFFDDIRVYVPAGRVPASGLREGIRFEVPVTDRDEGNAIVMDLQEMGLAPCSLEERGQELWLSLGPLASEDDAVAARDYLATEGYLYEETLVGAK